MYGNSDTYTWGDFRPTKQAPARTCEFWTGWPTDSSLSPWDQKSGDKKKTFSIQFSSLENYIVYIKYIIIHNLMLDYYR